MLHCECTALLSFHECAAVQSTVPHAVGLCEAKEPIMQVCTLTVCNESFAASGAALPTQHCHVQKAAAHRVSRLAENDASLKELVDAGVAHKLLAMIKPDVEPGMPTCNANLQLALPPHGFRAWQHRFACVASQMRLL